MLSSETIQLPPSYTLPVAIAAFAIPIALFSPWIAGALALFGMFLLFQASTLRLEFTSTDLDIYRGNELIRRFPYKEWQYWQIFYPSIPILFYFREVKSIHFLPILFDPRLLQECLQKYCPLSQQTQA